MAPKRRWRSGAALSGKTPFAVIPAKDPALGPRLRGGDRVEAFHLLRWAAGPWGTRNDRCWDVRVRDRQAYPKPAGGPCTPPHKNFKKSIKIFRVPRNVIDNKGQKMRKMGQMRIPRNVYQNK